VSEEKEICGEKSSLFIFRERIFFWCSGSFSDLVLFLSLVCHPTLWHTCNQWKQALVEAFEKVKTFFELNISCMVLYN